MRRFDVCALKSPRGGLAVVLQHDSIDHIETCIIAPLIASFASEREPRIRPTLDVGGKRMQLQTDRLAAVMRKSLGATVGSVSADQDVIQNAIDRLFIGF
jgi:CcdB protein